MYIQEDFFVECFSNEVYATLYEEHIRIRYSLEKQQRLKSFSKLAKTYKVKTNSKGKATFKIKKLTKKGTYKTTVTFKGNKYYNKVVKKVKIKIK
ncbi:hypothetical protein [Methanobrevibacter sp.]|uniref:hypothetical protein n=1 Tax=Methanobrevibacter sp. TaxID=66852 RepID=UPI00257F3B34|nr:hypothetical protein [Methanobrevibacter sp.]MBR2666379.1 hypothetical protein [Methanobrevibacter sp.]